MHPLSESILKDYQIRKSKQQKQRFIDLMRTHIPQLQIQEGGMLKSRNLIIGDVENAKVVLTAHYDTCAQLPVPNFITPKNPLLSILYGVLLVIPMLVVVYLMNLLLGLITDSYWVHYWLSLAAYFGMMVLMVAGPANKHTANDNTSGVITLCEIYAALTEEERNSVAFVFFDNEEVGLIGSSYFRKQYQKQMEGKLLINFDCVSDGDHILLAVSKTARKHYQSALENAFHKTEGKYILLEKAEKIYYPSDQAGFKQSVAVAALKKRKLIGYYMDRIHTGKDTVFDRNNIQFLQTCTITFLRSL